MTTQDLLDRAQSIINEIRSDAITPARLGELVRDMITIAAKGDSDIQDLFASMIYNVSQATENYTHTPTTARAAVPAKRRKPGSILSYKTPTGDVLEMFTGSDLSLWTNENSWTAFGTKADVKRLEEKSERLETKMTPLRGLSTSGTVLLDNTSVLKDGFFNQQTEAIDSSSSHKYAEINWGYDGSSIEYTGLLQGNTSIVCLSSSGFVLLKSVSTQINPNESSDRVRIITPPVGTTKIIFSCANNALSLFNVKVKESANVKTLINNNSVNIDSLSSVLNIINKTDDVLPIKSSVLKDGFFNQQTEAIDSSSSHKYAEINWVYDGSSIEYTGLLQGNTSIACLSSSGFVLLKSVSTQVNPSESSDRVRIITPPVGTTKIIFSCANNALSLFKLTIKKDGSLINLIGESDSSAIYPKGYRINFSLDNIGYYSVTEKKFYNTAGYRHSGYIPWTGECAKIQVKSQFYSGCGIAFFDNKKDRIYYEAGRDTETWHTSDNIRNMTIPVGTKYILISCKDGAWTNVASIYITEDVYKTDGLNIESKRETFGDPIQIRSSSFYLAFDALLHNINVDSDAIEVINIMGKSLLIKPSKPITYKKRDGSFTTNYPIPKLNYSFTFDKSSFKPHDETREIVGAMQFWIRYKGELIEASKQVVCSFNNNAIRVYKEDTSEDIVNVDISSMQSIDEIVDEINKSQLLEAGNYNNSCDMSDLMRFEKVYLVSDFANDPSYSTSRIDAFRLNFRSAVSQNRVRFEIISKDGNTVILVNGNYYLSSKAICGGELIINQSFCANNIHLIDGLPENCELVQSGGLYRYVTNRNPLILHLMLHSVFKCKEYDGQHLPTILPDLKPYPNAAVGVSIGRLTKIINKAKEKGYSFVSIEDVDRYVNGKIALPRKCICMTHDDREIYIHTDPDVAKVYSQSGAVPSMCLICDTEDYKNYPLNARAGGAGVVSHSSVHTPMNAWNSNDLYAINKQSYINSVEKGINPSVLVYPGGGQTPVVWESLEALGYSSAYLISGGYSTFGQNKYALGRIGMDDGTTWDSVVEYFV